MGGTTRTSGWAVFLFLAGFTILGTSVIGGGIVSLAAGSVVIIISGIVFKTARAKEEV